MDKGGGQPVWIIVKFYIIIIKYANVDKARGGGVKRLSMWIKRGVIYPISG